MARTTKKNEISLDEKLKAILVPDIEKPYQVPDNWCWGYLTAGFAECKDNYRKPVNATERSTRIGNVPYYGATGQVGWIDDYLTNEELVLLGEDGAPFLDIMKDKAYLITGKAWVNNHAHVLKSYFGSVGNHYLLHYLNIFNYSGFVNGTTRLKLTQSSMDTIPIPIAPVEEQRRIVDRIENLFVILDEAKEKAQTVLDSFDDRRAMILHKAFTGEITQNWRKLHALEESSEIVTVKSVCNSLQYGTSKKSADSGKVVVIRMGNIQQGEIDWSNLAYSNDEEDNVKYKLSPDDVLFNRTNSPDLVGKTAIYRGEYPAIFAGYLIKLDYDHQRVVGSYLNYILNSPEAKKYCNKVKSDGVNQSNINAKKIGDFSFRLPTIPEQQEITRILDTLLGKEKTAKETAQQTIEHIGIIKKSILARAFRGELGTNDPNDRNIMELLKKIVM